MPTDRWNRLELIFTGAIEQPPEARADFLDRACGADPAMRDEIRLLLTAAEQSGDFLGAPALEVFARQIVREGWTVRPGDRIASYTVEGRLGAGAMGEVWRARDERLSRDVAIKLLLPHASDAESLRACELEARAAGTLNHPNVLTVYDVGVHDGAPFVVTECLEGESLRARLGAGALSIDVALDIAVQVARGLGAAHDRGIVHRDLKPENVFLARDGRVKILDFGLAVLLDAAPAGSSPEHSSAAARSVLSGTAGYMAPEQVRGDAVDPRADIFALGAVLYEMLAGRHPFKGTSALETLDASLTLEPRDLSEVVPGLSPALARSVRRCLQSQPIDRNRRRSCGGPRAETRQRRPDIESARAHSAPGRTRGGTRTDRRHGARHLAVARVRLARTMGAYRRRARDSSALGSRGLCRSVSPGASVAGLCPRRSASATALAQRVHSGRDHDRARGGRRRVRRVPRADSLVLPRPDATQGRPRSARDHPAACLEGWLSADRGFWITGRFQSLPADPGTACRRHGARRERAR